MALNATPLRVVKVGGSLFDPITLPDRLRGWLDAQSSANLVLVAGGGPFVERVRDWDRQRRLDTVAAHWLCVDVMTATARLLHAWLPEFVLVDDERDLFKPVGRPIASIFSPAAWLRLREPQTPGTKLPPTWQTTSDAIAGRLAGVLGADELVLLKATLPPTPIAKRWDSLAAGDYVDAVLPQLAPELPPARLVDLRSRFPREAKVG
ncbi:MAG: hypothetical protein AAF961_08045 [Planctomycetota bacterium]